jgi:hypothetical protein
MQQINCPTCGAKTNSLIANCEYCGIEIKRAEESKITPQEMIHALTKRIQEAKGISDWATSGQGTAEAIGLFPLPTDTNLLAQFFLFCHGNVGEEVGVMTSIFKKTWTDNKRPAWKAKASAAYQALRLATLNNPQLATFIAPFDQIYGVQSGQGNKGVLGGIGKLFGR